MFEYLRSKSDIILAIHKNVKNSLCSYIAKNESGVKSFIFNDKGVLDFLSIKSNLQKGKTNFVILDSDDIMQNITVVNKLVAFKKEYDIQLVVLEHNDALDFEEITVKNLALLKLTYPSAIRENESKEAINFAVDFRRDNKVMPNQYATRGFDVTFDSILRMCQPEGFVNSTQKLDSEQIESQFSYYENNNEGVYILQYQNDLTIKQVL